MWLNLVMKACFNQSTKHSEMRTMMAGLKMVWRRESVGRDGRVREREKEAGKKEKREEEEAEESSIRLRRAMMNSMMPSWNRSTISVST